MFFDEAIRIGPKCKIIASVGVVFISPQNHVLPRAFSLTEPCSNNVAEYNTLRIGLQLVGPKVTIPGLCVFMITNHIKAIWY